MESRDMKIGGSKSRWLSRHGYVCAILALVSVTAFGNVIGVMPFDADNIFAASTRALDQMGLNIVDARIITSDSGYILDTYIVLEEDGDFIKSKSRCDEIRTNIRHGLLHLDNIPYDPLAGSPRLPRASFLIYDTIEHRAWSKKHCAWNKDKTLCAMLSALCKR